MPAAQQAQQQAEPGGPLGREPGREARATEPEPSRDLSRPLHDPLLNRMKEAIESRVPEAFRDDYERMVAAGMAVLYSQPTRRYVIETFDALERSNNDPMILAHAGIKLLEVLHRKSGGRISQEIGFLALQVLVLTALDSYLRARQAKVDQVFLARLMQMLAGGYLQFFGIDEAKLEQAVQEGARRAAGGGAARATEGIPPGPPPRGLLAGGGR